MTRKYRALHWALLLTGAALLLSHFWRYPSQVADASGRFHPDVTLIYPLPYTIFAPFFQAADALTLLSLNQHVQFLVFINLLWLGFRIYLLSGTRADPRKIIVEFIKLIGFNLAYAAAAAAIILIPRPMARLVVKNPDLLIVDFHSHTNHSWDARKSFSPARNMEWHRSAGFNAAFITDHNVVTGAEEAVRQFEEGKITGILPLRGEEVSLYKSHWAVLGNKTLIPNGAYDRGEEGIRDFLRDVARSSGICVIASLPEYWLHHWGENVQKFIGWGVNGFESVNSAPIAMDFPAEKKAEISRLAREHNLALTGISDNHGWGSTAQVWSLVELPGWQNLSRENLQEALVRTLKKNPGAVQVWSRVKQEPSASVANRLSDPLFQFWQTARSLPVHHRVISLLWLAVMGAIFKARGKPKTTSRSGLF